MRVTRQFVTTFAVLLFALAASSAHAAAGIVEGMTGTVTAQQPGKPARTLAAGSQVESGDTLKTGPNSSLSLRMENGEQLALRPDTDFTIERFALPTQANEPSSGISFYRLLKGGLRAITRAVRPRGTDSYRIATPVATIGIRGTTLDLAMTDALFAGCEEGAIAITNTRGTLVLNAGQYGKVTSINSMPAKLGARPEELGGTGLSTGALGVGLGALGLIGVGALLLDDDDDAGGSGTSTSSSTSSSSATSTGH